MRARPGVGAILLAMAGCQDAVPAAPPEQVIVIPPVVTGARIRYPDGQPGALQIAQGQRRAIYSMLNTREKMSFGDSVWNDDGIPPGKAWVRIDLSHQTLSVFRAGHEIGTTVILFGENTKPTPTGIFPVLEKKIDHSSTLYDAEMPYMLRLTGDGVAVHASYVRKGAATHGCIGIPIDFARRLYGQMNVGDEVAIVAS